MPKMHRSSAFTLKRRLEVTIKAMQMIVESCDTELKNTHPDDIQVKNSHNRERAYATAMICKLAKQLEETQADIRSSID